MSVGVVLKCVDQMGWVGLGWVGLVDLIRFRNEDTHMWLVVT